MSKIIVKDKEITITGFSDDDYVSLTDIAKFLNNDDPRYPIQNWMRLKDTIDYMLPGIFGWGFDFGILGLAGLITFVLGTILIGLIE